MAIIGGNTEKKEIGLSIGVSGIHDRTKINNDTGYLELVDIDVDGQGNPIYVEQGSWTSDVIDLGDIFQDFDKVFTDNTINGASSFAVLTRVSSNNFDWSDWTPIALDGTIQSDTKQYIQVRIDLFAGFVSDVFIIAKSDFNINEFLEEKVVSQSAYAVPTLTSDTSSPLGFAFSSSNAGGAYLAWKAFDNVDSSYMRTAVNQIIGFVGFSFVEKITVTKYSVGSFTNTSNTIATEWTLQASNNTTTGLDGDWVDLDFQTNHSWGTVATTREFLINNSTPYKAYRIYMTKNAGGSTNGIGSVNFFKSQKTSLSLKRDYTYDKELDSTWSNTGSLHRKKITRSQWQRIDRLEVL